MPLSKHRWKGLLKLLGPILFIFFIIKAVDPWDAVEHLKGIRIGIVLLSIFLFPVVVYARTLRWWIIGQKLRMGTSFGRLFQVYYISWFLSALPLSGISALSKIIYLKEEGTPAGKAIISITLDKLFDIMGLMFFGLFGFLYFPGVLFGEKHLLAFLGGTIIIMCLVLTFGRKIWEGLKELFKRYANKRLRQVGRSLEADLTEFWSGFNLKFFSLILGISIAIGLLRSLVLYVLAISLGLKVSFVLMVGCRALIGIVNVIPITISGLGTRDSILLLTLPLAGISREAALALGFVAFLWAICSKFSGVVFWLRRPLPTQEMIAIKKKFFSQEVENGT